MPLQFHGSRKRVLLRIGIAAAKASTSAYTKLLNTISVNAASLEVLNEELDSFGAYVQPTAQECQARNYLVHSIQQMSRQLFHIPADQCQVFGSFAARPVCTFESDVDLAIHGVVEKEDEDDDELFDDDEDDDGQEPDYEEEEEAPAPTTHPNIKKQEKVLKWKAALKDLDEQQQEDDKKKEAAKEDPPLFIIDRLGAAEEKETRDATSTIVVTDTSHEPSLEGDSQFADVSTEEEPAPTDDSLAKDPPLAQAMASQFADADDEAASGSAKLPIMVGDNDSNGADDGVPAVAGGTAKQPLVVDDDDDDSKNIDKNKNGNEDLESDDDSADKLEALKSRIRTVTGKNIETADRLRLLKLPDADDAAHGNNNNEDDEDDDRLERLGLPEAEEINPMNDVARDEQQEKVEMIQKPRSRSQSIISLCSATTCSDTENWDDSGMEVSFVTEPSATSRVPSRNRPVTGPTGETRTLVVRALNALSRKLRKMQWTQQLTVRKYARVPIINMETRFGYECDIALGGHNGTDTSSYASNQIKRFRRYVRRIKL